MEVTPQQPLQSKPRATKTLWLSICGPFLTLGLIILIWWHSAKYDWLGDGNFVFGLLALQCLITIAGMVFFVLALIGRMRGVALGVMIVLYPILQAIVQFAIFFTGCLAVLPLTDIRIGHGPPDGWEDRHQEDTPQPLEMIEPTEPIEPVEPVAPIDPPPSSD